jgi:hypothetical protein
MKYLAAVVFLTVASHSIYGQEYLEWNEYTRLTVNDFKGPVPDGSAHQTLILSFELKADLDTTKIKSVKSFNSLIVNLFNRNNSWIDWTDTSRLRYAITLFDLKEWETRHLRKRLKEESDAVLRDEYDKIMQECRKEFEKISIQYDRESESGNSLDKQVEWETKIRGHLTELSDYCKTCTPK